MVPVKIVIGHFLGFSAGQECVPSSWFCTCVTDLHGLKDLTTISLPWESSGAGTGHLVLSTGTMLLWEPAA
jgi:hypothetical protein